MTCTYDIREELHFLLSSSPIGTLTLEARDVGARLFADHTSITMNDSSDDPYDAAPEKDDELLEQVRSRLSALESDVETLPSDLKQCLERLDAFEAALAVLSRRLTGSSKPSPRQDELWQEVLEARDRHRDRLARLVVDWLRAGGTLDVVSPEGRQRASLDLEESERVPAEVPPSEAPEEDRDETSVDSPVPPSPSHTDESSADDFSGSPPRTQQARPLTGPSEADEEINDDEGRDAPRPSVASSGHRRSRQRSGSEDEIDELPEDWPLRERVAGMRAVIVGGNRRPEARAHIERAFQFEELDWHTGEMQQIPSLTRRIREGAIELVFILRNYIDHEASAAVEKACSDAEPRPIWVDSGYGLPQIRMALERFLEPSSSRE